MVRLYTIALSIFTLVLLSVIISPGGQSAEASLPEDYPVNLFGDYIELIENTTTFRDFLQPGDTDSYNIRLQNPSFRQIRYRIDLQNIPDGWLVFLNDGGRSEIITLDPGKSASLDMYVKNPSLGVGNILINVSDTEGSEFWPVTLRIICQEGPLTVAVTGSSYVLDYDHPAEFDITLENIGSERLNVSMDLDRVTPSDERIDETWTVVFEPRDLQLVPGAVKKVRAVVYPDSNQKQVLTTFVVANVDDINRPFISKTFTLNVQTIYDLHTSVRPAGYVKADINSVVEFNITLENRASSTDFVKVVEYYRPQGWPPIYYDGFDPSQGTSVSAGQERMFHPVVDVPAYATAGRHDIILQAVGYTNTTEITLRIEVGRVSGISALHQGGASEKTYRLTTGENLLTFKLQNNGNFFDMVRLNLVNNPVWTSASFHSVLVGSADVFVPASGAGTINVSADINTTYMIEGGTVRNIAVTLGPRQEISIRTVITVPGDTSLQTGGIVGIQYQYNNESLQGIFEMPLKLLLVDLEIVDLDGDSRPDIEIFPLKSEYGNGEVINFRFGIKNNYPEPTEDVDYVIEMIGVELTRGDLGAIPPGETRTYNITWKTDLSSEGHKVTLRLESDDYPNPPSIQSDEELKIKGGRTLGNFRLMALWLFLIGLIITWLVIMYVMAQRGLRKKEEEKQRDYEKVYGRAPRLDMDDTERGSLGPSTRSGRRSLERSKRDSLPPVDTGEEKGKKEKPGKGKRRSGTAKKKAKPLGRELDKGSENEKIKPEKKGRSGSSKRKPRSGKKTKSDEPPQLEEYEVPDPTSNL
ncbi:MAG: hypothetical protein ACMUIG_10705 [Thermoplasmatota archaeon]